MRSVLTVVAMLLAGCANMKYPGWQNVSLVSSVENKPCVKAGFKERCKDTQDDCDPWFQKRATLVNANTVVVSGSGTYFTRGYFQCQPGFPAYKSPVFSKAGYGSSLNTVTGQGFSRQVGGGVVTCAGQPVVMLPDTDYFKQAISDLQRGLQPDYQFSKEAEQMVKTSQCDAQGNFEFRKVPSGNWTIITNVSWGVGYVGYNAFGFIAVSGRKGGGCKIGYGAGWRTESVHYFALIGKLNQKLRERRTGIQRGNIEKMPSSASAAFINVYRRINR